MKYEMIFGDEGLFDGAPEYATHATKGGGFYFIDTGVVKFISNMGFGARDVCELAGHLVAERRIIAEPKRWTVEDKKAGRLPEVGAKYSAGDFELVCIFVDSRGDVWGSSHEGSRVKCYASKDINPIETPEEKAQREEDEFVKSEMKNTTLSMEWSCVYERGLRAAYRKLKGVSDA